MKHTNGEGVLVLALLACLSACADPVTRSTEPAISRDITASSAPESPTPERSALTKITRLVALAMDNGPARQHLKRDMRAAPFREHKLQLTAYLQSKDGRALLDRMVAANGGTERDLLETVAGVRPLEFYMPVRKHRESWTGNEEVLVVSQLEESDPIVAFRRERRPSLSRSKHSTGTADALDRAGRDALRPTDACGIEERPRSEWKCDRNARADGPQGIEPHCLRYGMRWRWWRRRRRFAVDCAGTLPGVLADPRREGAVDSGRAGDRGSHSGAEG